MLANTHIRTVDGPSSAHPAPMGGRFALTRGSDTVLTEMLLAVKRVLAAALSRTARNSTLIKTLAHTMRFVRLFGSRASLPPFVHQHRDATKDHTANQQSGRQNGGYCRSMFHRIQFKVAYGEIQC